jgi:hypothetical protein
VRSLVALVVCALAGAAASLGATTPRPVDLPFGFLFSPAGKLTALHAGATYGASDFPLQLRVTPPPGAGWGGAQWKANLFGPDEIRSRHLTCSTNPNVCKPPYFGWVTIGTGGTSPTYPPRFLVVVMTSFDSTPSVAATIKSLRTRGHGAVYEPSRHIVLAGYSGEQLDVNLTGASHIFVPFSPKSHRATGYADAIEMEGVGHAFRFDVLDVRGKTVVVFLGSIVMTADRFAAFMPKADALLESLRFPA